MLIGLPALKRGDPDFFPLVVGNYSLGGGGFVSRLMKEVREKRGFAYSVSSYFLPLAQTGPFQIGLQTKKAQANDALKVTRDVLTRFLSEGPSDEELREMCIRDRRQSGFQSVTPGEFGCRFGRDHVLGRRGLLEETKHGGFLSVEYSRNWAMV